ncbi:MAG: alpha/beta fold hydrolase [Deltaproteobacteria bacterium]|nr:alpha/beta fold hydrolase [Deltaproteobacteria bacterium]
MRAEDGLDDDDIIVPLELGPCELSDWPTGFPAAPSELECGRLNVPVLNAEPAGARTSIFVARQRSRAFPSGKAVFQLAGGPGGSAVSQSGIIELLMPGLLDEHDLVYVDQRGTGYSGYLECPGGFPELRDEWQRCADALAELPLEGFGSVEAAHDVDRVRRALGYSSLSLRGGSYGTRVGLEVLRQHGDVVDAAALDGVDPPDNDFFGWTLQKTNVGIELLLTDCTADPACVAVAPDLRADVESRRAALATAPRPIRVSGAADVEDDGLFVLALGCLVEDSYWRSRVPRAVHFAAAGDHDLWNGLLSELFGVSVVDRADLAGSYVAPGLYTIVNCTESLPNAGGLDRLRTIAATLQWGDGHLLELAEACAALPALPIDDDLFAPVASEVPTLLLSGAAEIQTPPALSTLTNARHVIIPHATHSTMVTPCGASLIEAFLQSGGDVAGLDASCVQEVATPAW